MMLDVNRPRPLLPGDEVWFQILYYEHNKGARIRYQQARVVMTDVWTVTVRYYESPHHEVRVVKRHEQVFKECPGEPLFSC